VLLYLKKETEPASETPCLKKIGLWTESEKGNFVGGFFPMQLAVLAPKLSAASCSETLASNYPSTQNCIAGDFTLHILTRL